MFLTFLGRQTSHAPKEIENIHANVADLAVHTLHILCVLWMMSTNNLTLYVPKEISTHAGIPRSASRAKLLTSRNDKTLQIY